MFSSSCLCQARTYNLIYTEQCTGLRSRKALGSKLSTYSFVTAGSSPKLCFSFLIRKMG